MRTQAEYEAMTKEELIVELRSSLAERTLLHAGQVEGAERDALLHDLRVHQIELEMQNRNLREAQDELEASRARYVDLYEFAPIAYFTFDEQGRVEEVNFRGAAMLRQVKSRIVGAPMLAMARFQSTESFVGILRRCFETARPAEGEVRFTARGGEPVWAHVDAEPVLSYAGRVRACRMAFADVTRLKAAEADATTAFERERRLRELLDVVTRAHAAVMLAEPSAALDREAGARHALQVMADEARALVGAELAAIGMGGSEEARFEPWVYSGIPEERARAIGDPPRAVGVLGVAAGRAAPLRLRDVRDHPAFRGFPEGHPPMKSFLSVPIRQEDRVLGTLYAANKRGGDAFTEDDERTLQILAARAAILLELVRLREVEARALAWQREVVTQMPEAVVLVGESQAGRISLNAAARALFGIDGRDAIEAVGPDGAPVPAEDLPHERASRGERICGLELRVRRPDGELVPVVASAAPVDDGRPASAVAVYRDVSLAKRLEQERDEWTGIVAHDLRQPTMVVSLSAQLLLRYTEGLGPKEAKSVSRIVEASHTLSRMIDDLLDVTLIDTQRLKLKLARVDVVALVREVVDRSRPMFGGRAVNVRAAEEAAVTAADTDRVSQVLTNFLSNAAKYSHPESDIEVRVSRADGAIEVAVENRGEGMKPEEASNVFQRFYRTQRAQAGTLGGLGLGLYICKGLIDAHGGAIGVRSVPGQTTTFWFRLPERSPPDAG